MSVRVRVPTPLRKYTQGADEVNAQGDNVKALVDDLEKNYPGIKERICDESGAVRRFVNIFVNGEDIRFLVAGLTNAGLSDWHQSCHLTFTDEAEAINREVERLKRIAKAEGVWDDTRFRDQIALLEVDIVAPLNRPAQLDKQLLKHNVNTQIGINAYG